MAVGDKYMVACQGSVYGITAVNVFHFEETSVTSDQFAALAVCEAFIEDIVPKWMLAVSSDYTLHCVTAQKLGAGVATPQAINPTTGNVGDRSGPSLPCNQVVCVSIYTATPTKRGRGRHYFSGIAMTDEEDNAISVDLANLFDTFGQQLTEPINESGGGQWMPVIYSKAANLFPPVIGAEYSPQVRLHRARTPRLC
jgi:hypothetical protein